MKILITADNEFTGDALTIGRYYLVEPADTGTHAQRKTLFALCREYWVSGCHSYNAKNFEHFYELLKFNLFAGTEKYYSIIDDNGNQLEEPIEKYRLKSLKDYSKKERQEAISNLIKEMDLVGVDTPKYRKILKEIFNDS